MRRALVVLRDGTWSLAAPKTPQSVREVPLPPETMRLLREHKARQNVRRLRLGPAYTDHGLVFAALTGGRLDLKNIVARYFKPPLTAYYPLPAIRLYDLRHTHATLALAAGSPLHVVSARLGHKDPTMTLKVYAHVLRGQAEDVVARLESYLSVGAQ